MERELRLRQADMTDTKILFRWRNDPDARANSFHTELIPYAEHVVWLANVLRDSSQEIYILCEEDAPIGQIRLSTVDDIATVSYSIDAAYRAQGYGRAILRLAENLCVERETPHVLRGYVKKKNIASQVIFETLGYECEAASEKDCLLYVKHKLQHKSLIERQICGGGYTLPDK